MDGATLLTLSRYDLIALIEAQAQQIASLVERIAALDAKLRNPRQRPDNSIPPSSKGIVTLTDEGRIWSRSFWRDAVMRPFGRKSPPSKL